MAKKQLHIDTAALVQWYTKNQRDFPWRRDPQPYYVWLAEIMSQQTVMAALLPYFHRFIGKFPQLQSLAQASSEEVLSAWAGLGYYSRARNLHKAAQLIATQGFPSTYEGWLALPGVGPYTAAAVASQCFQVPEPVWDGNVLRVTSRLLCEPQPYTTTFKTTTLQWLRNIIQETKVSPSAFNQALMELGATVCIPQNPRCGQCPLSQTCRAFHQGRTQEIPAPKPRRAFVVLQPRVFVVARKQKDDHQLWLEPRQSGQWFSGLWDFPSELGGHQSPLMKRHVPREFQKLPQIVKHHVTHHRFEIRPYFLQDALKSKLKTRPQGRWLNLSELFQEPPVPLSTTAKKVLKVLIKSKVLE